MQRLVEEYTRYWNKPRGRTRVLESVLCSEREACWEKFIDRVSAVNVSGAAGADVNSVMVGDAGADVNIASGSADGFDMKSELGEAAGSIANEGADVNCEFTETAEAGVNTELLDIAGSAGAVVNQATREGTRVVVNSQSLLAALLYDVIKLRKTQVVRYLVEAKGADVNVAPRGSEQPLFTAVMKRATDIVQLLLSAGADPNIEHSRSIPLCVAVRNGDPDSMKLLLEAGADVNHEDTWGRSPLMSALSRGNAQCVKGLLEAGADVNFACKWQHTPLLEAARHGDPECVKLLLEAGADVNHADSHGNTALKAATGMGDFYVRLPATGADVNSSDAEEFASARRSLFRDILALVKLLMAAGADVNKPAPLRMYMRNPVDDSVPLFLLAAGEEHVTLRLPVRQQIRFLPQDWGDLLLKNQCRKVIRKHLLTLDPHTNLFIRAPQLQMTPGMTGLPRPLVEYLLYNQTLHVDWENIECAQSGQRNSDTDFDSDSGSEFDSNSNSSENTGVLSP